MSRENLKRMSNSELLLRQFRKTQEKKNKPGKNTKAPELDSYNEFVDKIGAGIMGPIGSVTSKSMKGILGAAPDKKKLLKRLGASPGRIKAEFGTEMSRGGEVDVVDLTTEMVIDE